MADTPQERIQAVNLNAMSPEQAAAAKVLLSGPRGAVRGPFAVLLNNPGAFLPVQNLGAYLRYEGQLPANLRELAILATARYWRQEYEWNAHAPIARESGLSDAAICALAAGAIPDSLSDDEHAVLNFCNELHAQQTVTDANFHRVSEILDASLILELCVICGYYALLAMAMNVARNPLPSPNSPFAAPAAIG